MKCKITILIVNWFSTHEGDEYETYEVGKADVVNITEHQSQGEGDKWYYDVEFVDGSLVREFNPNSVKFN